VSAPARPLVDGAAFRAGMRRLGAAVSVVATDGAAGRYGFTASAVCAVTDDPPMLLVCLNRSAGLDRPFKANAVLAVNTLTAGDHALSDRFAGLDGAPPEARFQLGRWMRLVTGAPVLETAIVSFDCRLVDVKEVGTHSVLFGEVAAVRLGPDGERALVWLDRGYRELALAG
jgi:flavin reductase